MIKLSPLPPRPSDPDNRNDLLIVAALIVACGIVIVWLVLT